jgi:hypothetical protein
VLQTDVGHHHLPLQSLRNLTNLIITDGYIAGTGLPESWSELVNLYALTLPRCSFLPVCLGDLPRLRNFAMSTLLGVYPLNAESLLALVKSLPQLRDFYVFVYGGTGEAVDLFEAEILTVQQLVPEQVIRYPHYF